MTRRTHKSKKGGKFIGEGTHGCAFFPSLKCIGQPRSGKQYLSKMIIDKREADHEFAISTPIAEIDPTRKYFLTATSMCKHDQSDIRANNKVEKCRKFPLETPTYLIMYENGGDDLSELNIPANLYPEFFRGLIGLVEGLVKLHSSDMVHLDIKPDNIVGKFEEGSYKIRYIDFGMSGKTATLHADESPVINLRMFNLKTPYPYYPFDFAMSALERQRNPTISREELYRWYDYEENRGFYLILPQDSYWMSNGTSKYNEKTLSAEYAKTAKWYGNLSDHLKSIDVYGLAVSLCAIYKRVTGHIRVYDENGNPTINIIIEELLYNINDTKFRKFYGEEMYNFHKNLSALSAKFYEQILPFLLPFGNLRPKASDLLRVLSPLLSSTDHIFKNHDLSYKSLSSIGVNLYNPFIIRQSVDTGVTTISDPHSLSNSNNENFPAGLKIDMNKSKWTKPMIPSKLPAHPPKRTRKNRRYN